MDGEIIKILVDELQIRCRVVKIPGTGGIFILVSILAL